MESSQPTKTDETEAKLLYGFSVTVFEGQDDPVFEVRGNPTPRAILALAEDVVSRANGIVMNQMDYQLAEITGRLEEIKKRMDNSAGSTEAIVALLGKMVMNPGPDTINSDTDSTDTDND